MSFAEQIPTLIAAGRATVRGARALGRGAHVVLRPVAKVLWRPTVLCALALLALTASAAPGPLIDDTEQALGKNTAHIETLVHVKFARSVLAFAASATLASLVIGACLGGLAGAWIELRQKALGRAPLRRRWSVPLACALAFVVYAGFVLTALARDPQLYTDAFYAKGGFRAALQVFLTHRLGHERTMWLCIAIALVFAAPPWALPGLASAAKGALKRLPRWAPFLLAPLFLVIAWPRMPRSKAPSTRPNILILAADSFRHEGLDPVVMPHLTAIADRGVRFSNAYVSMARTLPSWTTFLTGRYAHRHGLRSMFPRFEQRTRDFDTLPTRLGKEGYETAVVSDYGGDAFSAVDLGFRRAVVPRLNAREIIWSKGLARTWPLLPFLHSKIGRRIFPTMREMRDCADASMLADDAVDALRDLRGSPFMLTVFFSASHAPYAAPSPYFKRFTDARYDKRYKYHKSSWVASDEKVDAAQVAQIHGLYQGTLASIDDGAKRVLDELERLGLRDETIVVILGDHGEYLADAKGRFYGHGNHLFGDHDMHVPFAIFDPRRPSPRVEMGAVSNADLAPTLYELTGVKGPSDMDGQSLVPALEGERVAPKPTFAETELWIGIQPDIPDALRFPYPDVTTYSDTEGEHDDALVLRAEFETVTVVARHRMVRDGKWKLLYIPTAKGVVYQLFDTESDPENMRDLAAQMPSEVERLKPILWSWMLGDAAMEQRNGFLAPKGVRIPEIDGQSDQMNLPPRGR